jgi:hypothetical protein
MDDTQQGCLWEARVAVRALTLERSCPGLNSGSVMSFPYPFSPRGVVILPPLPRRNTEAQERDTWT